MNKISGYVVENGKGGYDVITKTSQTKPFVIPAQEEITDEKAAAQSGRDFKVTDYDPFKTGSVKLPEWMNTKTEPTRSDAEILKEMEELAKEHARTGQHRDINNDKRYLKLIDEYVSSVSPDRAGILNKSVKEINGIINGICGDNSQYYSMDSIYQQVDSQRMHKADKEDREKEPIDFFIEALKNRGIFINIWTSQYEGGNDGIIGALSATIESDMYRCWVQDGAVSRVDFFDPSRESKGGERFGESVMGYKDGKLLQTLLPEEVSRRVEAYATYNAAYDIAVGDRKQLSHHSEEFKEAYNKAYERLKSEMA